jgi:2-hydroxychromene-2-carboxylate isomerase
VKTIDFFFDFASPYSYLAATQLPAIAERHGARIAWRPMVLAAVFDAAGNRMPASSPPKAKWMLGDVQRWAHHYGVPFVLNRRWPANTISTMRLVLVGDRHDRGPAVAEAAFRRFWTADEDITRPEDLAAIAAEAGLPDDAAAHVADPEIKARLKANTDEAIARGAFGAPAMFVGADLFWGNDRLPFLEAALR